MKFIIFRKAVLMEDEGREHYVGNLEATNEKDARSKAAEKWGARYFHASDFRAVTDNQLMTTNEWMQLAKATEGIAARIERVANQLEIEALDDAKIFHEYRSSLQAFAVIFEERANKRRSM